MIKKRYIGFRSGRNNLGFPPTGNIRIDSREQKMLEKRRLNKSFLEILESYFIQPQDFKKCHEDVLNGMKKALPLEYQSKWNYFIKNNDGGELDAFETYYVPMDLTYTILSQDWVGLIEENKHIFSNKFALDYVVKQFYRQFHYEKECGVLTLLWSHVIANTLKQGFIEISNFLSKITINEALRTINDSILSLEDEQVDNALFGKPDLVLIPVQKMFLESRRKYFKNKSHYKEKVNHSENDPSSKTFSDMINGDSKKVERYIGTHLKEVANPKPMYWTIFLCVALDKGRLNELKTVEYMRVINSTFDQSLSPSNLQNFSDYSQKKGWEPDPKHKYDFSFL